MELDGLIRSICLRDQHYMFFLGAGASITSGIASAEDCIWNWKLSMFLTQNSHVNPILLGPSTLPHVQKSIQKWLDDQGIHPAQNGDSEYAYYAEKCFALPADRQDWFAKLISKSSPHIGYRLLGLLTELAKVKWIWTSNFDDLVERGRPTERRRTFLQIGQDSSKRFESIREQNDQTIQVFLHGDYRYDTLSNTSQELQALNADLLRNFKRLVSESPLIVLGYSGRDNSIMNALEEAFEQKVKGGLFWCVLEDAPINPRFERLIKKAKEAGNTAEIIRYSGFDDFLIRLTRFWLRDTPHYTKAEEFLKAIPQKQQFSINHLHPDYGWNLGNAYEIELPREMLQFSINCLPEKGAYQKLKELIGSLPISASLYKGKVLALGHIDDINKAFANYLSSPLEPLPITNINSALSNGTLYEILLKSITTALETRGAIRIGKYALALPQLFNHKSGEKFRESIALHLDAINGKAYLLTLPDIHFTNKDLSKESLQSFKRDILWQQRNAQYMEAVKKWRELLFSKNNGWRFGFPPAKPAHYFTVNQDGPLCSRLYSSNPRPSNSQVVQKLSRFEKFKSFKINEPQLQFQSSRSIHPIKGLVDCGGPIETNDRSYHPSNSVRVGVICTEGHETLLGNFLSSLRQKISAHKNFDEEYLVDFPGFEAAFKCDLSLPQNRQDSKWKSIPRIDAVDPLTLNQKIIALIADKIKELEASGDIDVVLIYVPETWQAGERISTANLNLNLHDQIKAICVERGIRSQLIREKKVRTENHCRLRWWLSLALFTKSMRIPWIISPSQDKVAYVGLGYSLDQVQSEENHIVLGCSHIFDSNGLGMRFRLSKLKNPIWKYDFFSKRKNPYMSQDDAYQLGNRTRQLFYETHQTLPERVLICKKTEFLDEEIKGILSALKEIPHIDLLTIEQESAWRFCAYNPYKQVPDGFPIERGTGLILNDTSFLLWLHGNVKNLTQKGSYFQGKSRIPVPVRVTRYSGDTPIQVLANDLLSLTKMDWNTFALYKQMPVTITTPTTIARVGRILQTLSAESYDYRLFM